jgi:predicted HicB family RNase H-like nuclease
MTTRTEAEIDQRLAATAAEYVEEEQAAASEEAASAASSSAVFSVRLPPATYDAVRAAATRAHLTPSALIRQWVSERVADTGTSDLSTAVAALRRDVERVADLVRPA